MTRREPWPAALMLASGLVLATLGAILYAAPSRFFGVETPAPWLVMTPAFILGALRPGLAPSLIVFAGGLLQDVFSGGPIGPWAFAACAAYAVGASQKDALAGQSPQAVWIGFAVAVAAALAAAWLVGWLALGRPPGLGVLTAQAIVTIALGPLVARAMGGFARVADREEARA